MGSENDMKPWVQTYTGKRFLLLEPSPDMVDLDDIAVSLARQPRYNGHTNDLRINSAYSIAQHSVLVAQHCSPGNRLAGLLHDASEAYIGDIVGPLKRILSPILEPIEQRIYGVIAQKFGLDYRMPDEVVTQDKKALATEKRDMCGPAPHPWGIEGLFEPWTETIAETWEPRLAYQEFLRTFALVSHEGVTR